jgi:hypothetical protein
MPMDALGPLRSTAYLAVKRSQAAHFAHSTDPYYECFHPFTKLLAAGPLAGVTGVRRNQ